jgi:hypothetical protein
VRDANGCTPDRSRWAADVAELDGNIAALMKRWGVNARAVRQRTASILVGIRMPLPYTDRCSFCDKARDEVRRLVAGPGVFICNECTDRCTETLVKKEDPMRTWDHETIAPRLAAALRTGAARQRDAAAQIEKLAEAVLADDAAEIERRLARFVGLDRLGVTHDVSVTLDLIRFLWPPMVEP